MKALSNLLFVLGIALVLWGTVAHGMQKSYGPYLVLGGIACMVPFFIQRSIAKTERDSFRRMRNRRRRDD